MSRQQSFTSVSGGSRGLGMDRKSLELAWFEAARKGNAEFLIRYTSQMHCRRESTFPYHTALMLAAEKGHLQAVIPLLQYERDETSPAGWTALMSAAKSGHSNIVRRLIPSQGGRRTTKTEGSFLAGTTALLVAASEGHFSCVDLLYEKEKDCSRWNGLFHSAYRLYAAETRRYISEVTGVDNYGRTPLMYAVMFRHDGDETFGSAREAKRSLAEVICQLAEVQQKSQDLYGRTALMYAAECGNVYATRYLIAKAPSELGMTLFTDRARRQGMTALMLAAAAGHADVCAVLAAYEAGRTGACGVTALMYAAREGHVDCVRVLAPLEARFCTVEHWDGFPPGTSATTIAACSERDCSREMLDILDTYEGTLPPTALGKSEVDVGRLEATMRELQRAEPALSDSSRDASQGEEEGGKHGADGAEAEGPGNWRGADMGSGKLGQARKAEDGDELRLQELHWPRSGEEGARAHAHDYAQDPAKAPAQGETYSNLSGRIASPGPRVAQREGLQENLRVAPNPVPPPEPHSGSPTAFAAGPPVEVLAGSAGLAGPVALANSAPLGASGTSGASARIPNSTLGATGEAAQAAQAGRTNSSGLAGTSNSLGSTLVTSATTPAASSAVMSGLAPTATPMLNSLTPSTVASSAVSRTVGYPSVAATPGLSGSGIPTRERLAYTRIEDQSVDSSQAGSAGPAGSVATNRLQALLGTVGAGTPLRVSQGPGSLANSAAGSLAGSAMGEVLEEGGPADSAPLTISATPVVSSAVAAPPASAVSASPAAPVPTPAAVDDGSSLSRSKGGALRPADAPPVESTTASMRIRPDTSPLVRSILEERTASAAAASERERARGLRDLAEMFVQTMAGVTEIVSLKDDEINSLRSSLNAASRTPSAPPSRSGSRGPRRAPQGDPGDLTGDDLARSANEAVDRRLERVDLEVREQAEIIRDALATSRSGGAAGESQAEPASGWPAPDAPEAGVERTHEGDVPDEALLRMILDQRVSVHPAVSRSSGSLGSSAVSGVAGSLGEGAGAEAETKVDPGDPAASAGLAGSASRGDSADRADPAKGSGVSQADRQSRQGVPGDGMPSLLDSLRRSTTSSAPGARRGAGAAPAAGRHIMDEAAGIAKECELLCARFSQSGAPPPSPKFYSTLLENVRAMGDLLRFSCARADEVSRAGVMMDAKMSSLEAKFVNLQVSTYSISQRLRSSTRLLELERQKSARLAAQVEELSAELEKEKKAHTDLQLEAAGLRSRLEAFSAQEEGESGHGGPSATNAQAAGSSHGPNDDVMRAKLDSLNERVTTIEKVVTAPSARNSFMAGGDSFLGDGDGPSMFSAAFGSASVLPPKSVMGQAPGQQSAYVSQISQLSQPSQLLQNPADSQLADDPVGQENGVCMDQKLGEVSLMWKGYQRQFADRLRQKTAENEDLQKKLQEVTADRDALAGRLREAEVAMQSTSERAASLASQLRAEKGRADDLQARVASNTEVLQSQSTTIASLQEQGARLQSELDEARSLHEQAAETIEALQERSQSLQDDVAKAEKRLREEQEECAAQSAGRRRAEGELEAERGRVSDLQRQVRQGQDEAQELSRRLEEQESAAKAAEDASAAERKRVVDSVRSVAASIIMELAPIKTARASIVSEVSGFISELRAEHDKILASLDGIASLRSGEKQRVAKVVEDLRGQLASLGSTVALLSAE